MIHYDFNPMAHLSQQSVSDLGILTFILKLPICDCVAARSIHVSQTHIVLQGTLPLDYLNLSTPAKAEMIFSNAQQILTQFQVRVNFYSLKNT